MGLLRQMERPSYVCVTYFTTTRDVQRLSEELFPLLDRANRFMLRNLKALRALKQLPAPNVNTE